MVKLERQGKVLEPKLEVGAIFNCGAAEYKGDIYLLPRVVKKGYTKKTQGYGYDNYVSEIRLAKSKDGKNFTLSNEPIIKSDNSYDLYGCEDARVTKLEGEYFITYTAKIGPAFSGGDRIGLASTKDFSEFEKHGVIGPDENDKDVAIFPDKINGKIAILHRIYPNIQIAYFDNIKQLKENHSKEYWKDYLKSLDEHIVLRKKHKWESKKIGVGPPPIKTEKGWLLIYHGTDDNHVYRAGAALLDLNNPQKIIGRTYEPILEPIMEYEKIGDVPNVTFPEGAVVRGDELFVYYGAADKICCLATCNLNELINSLLKEK
ncbi:MAG: glycosidase [Candidatus Aenigmarchaeota archaeon]|nr:glycosidase [Candidatus Aenigmarchaeota archaeon]